ncbi:MAG TPA: YggS family pyridoxal phosphate enzyme [Acidimicrobiales bacterium]|nr:YggS family pyridoxal phosphate enzyme [Acidimicrobiales bacterium]
MTTFPASSAEDELAERVAANLAQLRERILEAGRTLESVRIVGVTKTFAPEVVRVAAAAGLSTFGENYVDELEVKRSATSDLDVRWHFLGALQTNKIARIVRAADVVCGVARVRELEKIALLEATPVLYVQVDFTGSAQRNGARVDEVAPLVRRGHELGLEVRGLMTIAPPEPEPARRAFLATSALADELGLVERSMGMSDDLEIALECGTTEVRVGRALFGQRDALGPPRLT